MDGHASTVIAHFIAATRGRKVAGLARCRAQTCCSISSILGIVTLLKIAIRWLSLERVMHFEVITQRNV
jgi:hypothetical protein